jgi:hypothetical protein
MESASGIYRPRLAHSATQGSAFFVAIIVRQTSRDFIDGMSELAMDPIYTVANESITDTIRIAQDRYTRLATDVAGMGPPIILDGPTGTDIPAIELGSSADQVEIDMDREELKAHLEAQDARIDVRLKSFEQTVKDAMAQIRLDSAEAKGEMKAMHVELGHMKNIKGAVWGAAGATIIGVGSILAAMLSFGVSSFDTGRETSQLVESAKQQTQATQKLLEQIQQQQNMLVAPPVSTEKTPRK